MTVSGFAAMTLLFAGLTWLGMEIFVYSNSITTIKPICGVAMAIAIIQERKMVWRVALAVFISGLADRLVSGETIQVSLWGTGMVALSVIGVFFATRKYVGPSPDFAVWKQLVKFMLLCFIISAAIGLIFPLPFVLLGGEAFWPYWNGWCLPTTLGFVLFTPAVSLASNINFQFFTKRYFRFTTSLLLLTAAIASNFFHLPFPQPVLVPLALFVVCLVGEIEGAALGLVLTMTALVIGAIVCHGIVAVGTWPMGQQLYMMQALMVAMTVILLPAGAAMTARRKLQDELYQTLRKEARINEILRANEQDLRAGEERFRLLADNASDLIVQTSMDGEVVYASPSLTRVLGYKPEETSGQIGYSVILEKDRHIIPAAREQLLRNKEPGLPVTMRYRAYHRDGHIVWLENRQSLLLDKNGQPTGFLAMLRDITDRKIIEDELLLARDQANAANRAKAEFLANMSHELRTPLNAILGFSEIIAGQLYGPLGHKKYVEYAEDVHKSGAHLLELINEVLDLSKIDAGKIELRESTFPVNELIDDAVLLARGRIKSGVMLDVIVPTDLHILADKRLTKQILINLLSNAIKFTPAGGTVTVGAQERHGGGCEIYVADTGIGMDATQLETAFSPYGQVNAKIAEDHQGTGLGLPIARSLARSQGGDIIAQSAPGQGTRMTLILPQNRIVEPTMVPPLAAQSVR